MVKHAVTALVVIALAAAITLMFSSRGYEVAPLPTDEIEDATAAYKYCDELLVPLNLKLSEALADDAHRAERFAAALSPAETACTKAEAMIRGADKRHPRDIRVANLRRKIKLGQDWLRSLSTAFAAYEVAAKQGPADKELAALKALL